MTLEAVVPLTDDPAVNLLALANQPGLIPAICVVKSRMDPKAAAARAHALELRARRRAEGAFERCDDLMQTDGELIAKSREMIDLARRLLQQVPKLEQFTP